MSHSVQLKVIFTSFAIQQNQLTKQSQFSQIGNLALFNANNQIFALDHSEESEVLQLKQINQQHQQLDIIYDIHQPQVTHQSTFSLRFNRQHTSSNLTLSPSGLICSVTEKDQLGWAIAMQGYRTGVHYWEIICPLSCDGIQVGIIQAGFDFNAIQNYKELHLLEFKTTTMRVIGIKLDLNKGTLRTWLNGNYNEKKNFGINGQVISPGIWHPMVTIKNLGNVLYLNPFGTDPEGSIVTLFILFKFLRLAKASLFHKIKKYLKQLNKQEIANLKMANLLNYHRIFRLKEQVKGSSIILVKIVIRNMVFLSGTKLKLLRDGITFRQRMKRLFHKNPKDIKEEAELIISINDFNLLIEQINWQQLNENELIFNFLTGILQHTTKDDEVLFFKI